MHIVGEEEFYEKADIAFSKVFVRDDTIGLSFSKQMINRTIVYPIYNDIHDAIPISFIIDAAREIGDKGCYFHRLGMFRRHEPDFFYYSFEDLLEYHDDSKPKNRNYIYYPINQRPMVMYSENGYWGAILDISQRYGLLGGNDNFMNLLEKYFPKLKKRVFSYLYSFYIECNSDGSDYYTQVSYMKPELIHIYGEIEAIRIIKMSPKELLENSEEDLLL